MSPKEIVMKMYQAMADGDYDTARSLLAPDYFSHTQTAEVDPDAFVKEVESIKATITNFKHQFILALEEGDMGVVMQRLDGIHKDTGEKIGYRSADFFRVDENGQLAEHWDAVTFDGEDMFDIIELEE
jgi:predicted SnoaL-like aldol condensation-catalyzing enzyme